jgi:large subunit ribosomal protein L10
MKEMIISEYQNRFGELDSAVLIEIRGMDANENNQLRGQLAEKQIKVTILKNSLARSAFKGGKLEPLSDSLEGSTAIVTGADSVVDVAREMVRCAKEYVALELKAAVLDGELFEGNAGLKQLSDFPTKDEAQANVVAIALAPFKNVVGAASSPGSSLMGVVKQIQEKLENGESISKAG